MEKEYYIITDGQRIGPIGLEELRTRRVGKDTLIWFPGLADWTPAGKVAQLAFLFEAPAGSPAQWYAMINGRQVGPGTLEWLASQGLNETTPVWRPGMGDWTEAGSEPQAMQFLRTHAVPPRSPFFNPGPEPRDSGFKQTGSAFGQQPYWQQQGGPVGNDNMNGAGNLPFNWLPWAIVATVAGLFTSCLGAIFGIIAIVNANKANGYYRMGQYGLGNQANGTAKTMTIIGFIFAALGLVFSGLMLSGTIAGLHLPNQWI